MALRNCCCICLILVGGTLGIASLNLVFIDNMKLFWLPGFMMVIWWICFFPALAYLRSLLTRTDLWRAKHCPCCCVTEIERVAGFDVDPTDTILRIDASKLSAYMNLSPRQAQFVLNRLPYAPIYKVEIELTGTMESVHYSVEQRWILLCQALGSIPTLQELEIYFSSSTGSAQDDARILLQNMHQAKRLQLRCNKETSFVDAKEIARGLLFQQSLASLDYSLPVSTYKDVLPVIQSLSQLQSLSVSVPSGIATIDASPAEALSNFLAVCSLASVHLPRLTFENLEAWRTFCRGISGCSAKELHLPNLDIPKDNAAALGVALASSQIGQVTFTSTLLRTTGALSSCLLTLADFSSTPRLALELVPPLFRGEDMIGVFGSTAGFNWDNAGDAGDNTTFVQHLCMVVRAAATCSTLAELKLPCMGHSNVLDDALANLLESGKASLETLTIYHAVVSTEAHHTTSLPKFLRVLQSNVTIKCVHLGGIEPLSTAAVVPDPWSETFRQEVETITRLNRHGRAYLHDDRCNATRGVNLLEAVKDDHYCLYVHLRENPALCCRNA